MKKLKKQIGGENLVFLLFISLGISFFVGVYINNFWLQLPLIIFMSMASVFGGLFIIYGLGALIDKK